MPHTCIENQAVRDILCYAQARGTPVSVIEHPRESVTCADKRSLMLEHAHLYANYGDIRIARGALLSIDSNSGRAPVLHLADSEDRIDFKGLRRLLGVRKKGDIRFCPGNIEASIGLPVGGVSPFVAPHARLDCLVFAGSLFGSARHQSLPRWDFAFNRLQSVVIDARTLMAYMIDRKHFRIYLLDATSDVESAVSARS